jgi:hypothetical protein
MKGWNAVAPVLLACGIVPIWNGASLFSNLYDRAVIMGMKQQFRYKHGLLLDLPAGPGATDRKSHLEWL